MTNTRTSILKNLSLAFALLLTNQFAKAENSVGELELSGPNQSKKLALLLDTAINGEINGMLANITVKQTFKNESDDWVNGRYVFPLPEGAAVDSLTIEIGERLIEGVIKEKEQAKKVFEQAKREGKKAGLLQQHRPNLFSMAVANIGPQENVVATITFIDRVKYENDSFSLKLPTTLTPRYIPGAPVQMSAEQRRQFERELKGQDNDANNTVKIDAAHGWAANTANVDDASAITPPQTYRVGSQTSHRFSLELSINSGLDLQQFVSDSHPIRSTIVDDSVLVTLANGLELMNADLNLSWTPIVGTAPKAAIFQQQLEQNYFTMMMLTPPTVSASLSLPRDVTFIVDSSGSMAGQSMQQAKQALHNALTYLSPSDRFNIIDFDSSYNALYSQSQDVTFDHLQQAKRMIDRLHADGGTEMMGALSFALNSARGQNYLKQIIFITDGSIGNEAELFKLINNKLGDARLFTVGIGSAPNSFFMSKAAKFGRGSYTYINNVAQVSNKMAALFEKITKPVLRDLKINWPTEVEQYPARLPDLYAGEPITVLVRSKTPISDIEVKGSMLNTPWSQSLTVNTSKSASTDNLDTVWARQKVADLMDKYRTGELSQDQVKPVIVELGIAHHILTKFTAFVAVEKTPSKPEFVKAKHKNIPNLMPKGSTMRAPQTATPATLFSILGLAMILLSVWLRRIRRGNSVVASMTAAIKSSCAKGFGGKEA